MGKRERKVDWRALAVNLALLANEVEDRDGQRYRRCAICGRFIKVETPGCWMWRGHARGCEALHVLRLDARLPR